MVDADKKAKAVHAFDLAFAKVFPDADLDAIRKGRTKVPHLTRFDPKTGKSHAAKS